MPTYLVERYLPGASLEELAAAAARAEEVAMEMRAEGTPVLYLGSILVPLDEMCFHLFRSPSPEAIKEAKLRARISFERMTPAVFSTAQPPSSHSVRSRQRTSRTEGSHRLLRVPSPATSGSEADLDPQHGERR